MKNDIRNQIIFKGEDISRHIQKYLSFDDNGELYFDFEKIKPTPTELKIKDDYILTLGIRYLLNCIPESLYLIDTDFKKVFENELVQNKYVDNEDKVRKEFNKYSFSIQEKAIERGRQGILNLLNYDYPSEYLWHIKNWGCPINSTDTKFVAATKDECTIYFDTFMCSPYGIVFELCKKHTTVDIKVQFGSNIFGRRCGVMFTDNDNLYQVIYNDFTKESYDVAIDLFGKPDQLVLNTETNKYEWMG